MCNCLLPWPPTPSKSLRPLNRRSESASRMRPLTQTSVSFKPFQMASLVVVKHNSYHVTPAYAFRHVSIANTEQPELLTRSGFCFDSSVQRKWDHDLQSDSVKSSENQNPHKPCSCHWWCHYSAHSTVPVQFLDSASFWQYKEPLDYQSFTIEIQERKKKNLTYDRNKNRQILCILYLLDYSFVI